MNQSQLITLEKRILYLAGGLDLLSCNTTQPTNALSGSGAISVLLIQSSGFQVRLPKRPS